MDDRGIVELLAQDGRAVTWVGPCPGGEFGASFIDFDGKGRVLKWWPYDEDWAVQLSQTVRRVARVRANGFLAPAVVAHGRVSDWLWHVQERAPGALVDTPFTQGIVDQMVAINEAATDAATGEGTPWGGALVRSLRVGLDGWCVHSVVEAHSRQAAALLRRIVTIGHSLDGDAVPDRDFVHEDFHHRNVLVNGGRVTAVIDCERNEDGDRRFDLVTLAYWLGLVGAEPGVAEGLAVYTESETPHELLVAYRAHMILRNIDFYARAGRREPADLHVGYGEAILDALGA